MYYQNYLIFISFFQQENTEMFAVFHITIQNKTKTRTFIYLLNMSETITRGQGTRFSILLTHFILKIFSK